MEKFKATFVFFLLFITVKTTAQIDNFRFQKYLSEKPNELTAFAIAYEGKQTLEVLRLNKITVKQITPNWIYVQTTATKIKELVTNKLIKQFYFEHNRAMPMSDTARIVQHVKEVQEGYGDLLRAYTGKNVVVGFVDEGIDWTHPDFIDANGVHRVIAYWDQSAPTDGTAPQPYNYGRSCDSLAIANGTCLLTETGTYHGSTVAGAATGNGRANGKEIGMATEAKIVAIETDFSKANWTLTVADACDYLFKIADSLGLPAVMNLSVGDYLGSHDGDDPASELMEQLLDAKKGRIIVGAMGNSGAQGNYHLKGKIYSDTNFVWFKNNPTNQIKANSIYFDWWSDTATSNNLNIAFAANSSINYAQTPYTNFYNVKNLASYTIDTLKKFNGTKLGIVEIYKTPIGKTYEIEVLIRDYDSLNYLYQLAVSGLGEFDLWSGKWMGLNDMETTLPSVNYFPSITKYIRPDSLSTIVSSWACSEKMITVGNIRNRVTHIDNNGNVHAFSPTPPVGYISFNSSRGPARRGTMKPDVASNGDMMMGAAPAFMRNNAAYNGDLELGGWHARNGGTSMASPVVAGIAALYLEKCPSSSYKDFLSDLHKNTDVYAHYGSVPNYTYGYGRINAYKLLVHNGDFDNNAGFCGADFMLGIKGLDSTRNFQWSTGATTPKVLIDHAGTYSVTFEYGEHCYSTLSKVVAVGMPPIQPIISQNGNVLTSTPAVHYQWFKNGAILNGEVNQTLTIVTGGNYQVKVSDSAGCSNYSDYYNSVLGINELADNMFAVFPNPTNDEITVSSNQVIDSYQIFSIDGKLIEDKKYTNNIISFKNLTNGAYILMLKSNDFTKTFKILKN